MAAPFLNAQLCKRFLHNSTLPMSWLTSHLCAMESQFVAHESFQSLAASGVSRRPRGSLSQRAELRNGGATRNRSASRERNNFKDLRSDAVRRTGQEKRINNDGAVGRRSFKEWTSNDPRVLENLGIESSSGPEVGAILLRHRQGNRPKKSKAEHLKEEEEKAKRRRERERTQKGALRAAGSRKVGNNVVDSASSRAHSETGAVLGEAPYPPELKEQQWSASDAAAVRRAEGESARLAVKYVTSAVGSEEDAPHLQKGAEVLIGRSLEQLEQLAVEYGQRSYRGRQLHQFLYQNKGRDFLQLPQLPLEFRTAMAAAGLRVGRMPVHHVAASVDGTAKLLLRLDDDRLVEAVGIPADSMVEGGSSRLTACISSQVGCPLRCSFCATGKGGFARNLLPHEIIGQVLAIEELFGSRVSNIVFMGMGEPLLNLPAVIAAHRCLNKDLGIGQRMMTISTVGVPNTIRRLAKFNLQSTLAISLHAPNQGLREQLIPSAKAYPLESLLADCQHYFQATGRRVSFEYTLLASVNDQEDHALELADLLRKWKLGQHVNVIPYNPVDDSAFRRPSKAYVKAFVEALNRRGVTATVRQTRGLDANAACGQLRNAFQKLPMLKQELSAGDVTSSDGSNLVIATAAAKL